jgi:hypothetical protein
VKRDPVYKLEGRRQAWRYEGIAEMRRGDRIRHPVFGNGRVTGINVPATTFTVAFHLHGTRELIFTLSKHTIIRTKAAL